MRMIMYTGKGGVGKTSIASATGVRCAELGYRTLVMSLDPAHSLADSFDLDRRLLDNAKGKPVQVTENLNIQEVDVQEEMEENWGEVHAYISALLNVSGLEEVLAEEVAILPGMEEVTCLLHINRYAKADAFDVILLDCAPTGESLRFISMPTALEWYMKKLFKIERTMFKVMRPVMKNITSIPLPNDDYFEAIASLYERLAGVDDLLTDPKVTSVRLVTNPEKMVIKETQRAFMYFCLYGLCIDAVIVNRLFPEGESLGYFAKWRETQQRYLTEIKEFFSPVRIWQLRMSSDEIVGIDDLRSLADELYGDENPTKCFRTESPHKFSKKDGKYQVRVKLPFLSKEDVDLSKSGDELIIRIGGFKKHVVLPRSMAARDPTGAKLEGDTLVITFGGEKDGKEKG